MEKEQRLQILMKEVDVTQNIINRMGRNSFLIKGWTLSLVVITLLLKNNQSHFWLAFIPLFSFWFLDAYFLRQERLFRKLYEWIIANRLTSDDFIFDMDVSRFKKDVSGILGVMFSVTLFTFYFSVFILIIIYIFFIYMKGC